MLPELNQACLTMDLDERELLPLLGAGGYAGVAALGVVVNHIARAVVRDRTIVRGWLATAPEATT